MPNFNKLIKYSRIFIKIEYFVEIYSIIFDTRTESKKEVGSNDRWHVSLRKSKVGAIRANLIVISGTGGNGEREAHRDTELVCGLRYVGRGT